MRKNVQSHAARHAMSLSLNSFLNTHTISLFSLNVLFSKLFPLNVDALPDWSAEHVVSKYDH